MSRTEPHLPPPLMSLLDGKDLERKVGETIVLASAEPSGWPRLALLSVGEIFAPSDTEIRLALYPDSRTTAALTASGRALLLVVAAGTTYKVEVRTHRDDRVAVAGPALAVFRGTVSGVTEDVVDYATVRHGIEYTLPDDAFDRVLARWRRQLELLTRLDPP